MAEKIPEPQNESEMDKAKLAHVRARLQVEMMKEYGNTDQDFSQWKNEGYSEDFQLAFDRTIRFAGTFIDTYLKDEQILKEDIGVELKHIHTLRMNVEEKLIHNAAGGFLAVPVDFRNSWLKQYRKLYTEIFSEYILGIESLTLPTAEETAQFVNEEIKRVMSDVSTNHSA